MYSPATTNTPNIPTIQNLFCPDPTNEVDRLVPDMGEYLHRPGACYWKGKIYSAIPRCYLNVKENYYLDLQVNNVSYHEDSDKSKQWSSDNSQVALFNIDNATTFNMTPSQPAYSRYLATCEVVNPDAAYVFWMRTQGGGNPEFFYMKIPDGDVSSWSGRSAVQVNIDGLQPQEIIIDFTSTVIGGQVYLIYACIDQDTKLHVLKYFKFSENIFSSVQRHSLMLKNQQIVSIDATTALYSTNLNKIPRQQMVCIVTLYKDENGNSSFSSQLFSPASEYLSYGVYVAPILSLSATAPQGSIRVTWGSVPIKDAPMIGNGLVLMYVDRPESPSNISISQKGYISVVNLDDPSKSSSWFEAPTSGAESIWGDYGVYVPWQGCFVPMIVDTDISGTSAENSQSYINCYLSAFISVRKFGGNVMRGYWGIQPIPCYVLEQQPPTVMATTYNQSFTQSDLEAAISSWILLGVITGLPPYPTNAQDIKLKIGSSSSGATTSDITSSNSVSFGAGVSGCSVDIGGSITTVTDNVKSSDKEWSLSIELDFAKSDPTDGWLVFAQPVYKKISYNIKTIDNNQTDIVINSIYSVNDPDQAASFSAYPFKLKDVNLPYNTNNPIYKALCHFPVDGSGNALVSWPNSSDYKSWINYAPDLSAWKIEKNKITGSNGSFSVIQVDFDHGFSESLDVGNSSSNETVSTNTIKVDASVDILDIFKINGSGELSVTNTIKTRYGNGFSIKIDYESLQNPASPQDTDCEDIQISPLFYLCSDNNAPWVPTPFSRQRPWLLTWSVTSASPLP